MDNILFAINRLKRLSRLPIGLVDDTASPWQRKLAEKAAIEQFPVLEIENGTLISGVCADQKGCAVYVGPADLDQLTQQSHQPLTTLPDFLAVLVLVYQMLTGQMITEEAILLHCTADLTAINIDSSDLLTYRLDQNEQEISHLSYGEEQKLMGAIRDGNVKDIIRNFDLSLISRTGRVARKLLKNYEYLACSAITLATRAAIDGGLEPQMAYAMSDLYLQQLENCASEQAIFALMQTSLRSFAEAVARQRMVRSRSSYIEACKSYIESHLNKPLRLDGLAAALDINRSYLSRRFSQSEGVGIQEYIRRKRIEAACGLLRHSGQTIAAIASYLCFPSQSYFGQVFRHYTGMSPQKYRLAK